MRQGPGPNPEEIRHEMRAWWEEVARPMFYKAIHRRGTSRDDALISFGEYMVHIRCSDKERMTYRTDYLKGEVLKAKQSSPVWDRAERLTESLGRAHEINNYHQQLLRGFMSDDDFKAHMVHVKAHWKPLDWLRRARLDREEAQRAAEEAKFDIQPKIIHENAPGKQIPDYKR